MPFREGDDPRRRHLRIVESITIPTPCRQSWTSMHGDEVVRHCARCDKDVFNLSAMSLEQIATLVEAMQGNLCGRFFRRPDGRLVTDYCPSTDRSQVAARIAGAAVVAAGVAAGAVLVASAPKPVAAHSLDEELTAIGDYEPRALGRDEYLEELTGDLVLVTPTVHETAIQELDTAGGLDEARRRSPEPWGEPVCNRFTPAGSFEDVEIQDRAPPSIVHHGQGFHGMPLDYVVADPCPMNDD